MGAEPEKELTNEKKYGLRKIKNLGSPAVTGHVSFFLWRKKPPVSPPKNHLKIPVFKLAMPCRCTGKESTSFFIVSGFASFMSRIVGLPAEDVFILGTVTGAISMLGRHKMFSVIINDEGVTAHREIIREYYRDHPTQETENTLKRYGISMEKLQL
ncbi:hypothetical protein HY213_00740 [Candidatus Peregrinibacteria bacterium]|nr:hypothetical protein [Candidatus Peregrinibacteria bacterium]